MRIVFTKEAIIMWMYIIIAKDMFSNVNGLGVEDLRTMSYNQFTGLSSKEIMEVFSDDKIEQLIPLALKMSPTPAMLEYWDPNKTTKEVQSYRRDNNVESIKKHSMYGSKLEHKDGTNLSQQRRNSRLRTRSVARSTRLVQMNLMQPEETEKHVQEKEPVKKHKISTSNDSTSRVTGRLNVYALVPQVYEILEIFPNVNVTYEILGRTASYNNIVLFKISQRKQEPNAYFRADDMFVDEASEKKIIFIVHALSAMGITQLFSLTREKYVEKLLSYYLRHLDKFDIFWIAMANPDGYVKNSVPKASLDYQIVTWNKNVSPQGGCSGVALDRNFDVAWNSSHGTFSTCSQHYPGSMPFSEPESRAVRDIFHRYSHKIIAYFHVHAGTYNMNTIKGDAVLYPRGYTEVPLDDDKYLDIKGEIDEAMKNASFKVISVTVDTIHNWYGKVYGTSVDYASTIYGIPYAMELVMQIYMSSSTVLHRALQHNDAQDIEYYALTEIWQRVLDVIFNNIARNLNSTDNK